MARYKIVDEYGIYFTTHTLVEWLQIIYTDKVCQQKLEYMHNNPVVKGFVSKPEHWLYSSARNYILDDDSVLKVELLEML